MDPFLSHLLTLLGGVAIGASGHYFGEKYTDQRRKGEATRRANATFERMKVEMPKLIAEMRDDFAKPENSSHREFIVARRTWALQGVEACLAYYENEHPNLKQQIMILENNGCISDVSVTDLKRYRMSEAFVEWLKK